MLYSSVKNCAPTFTLAAMMGLMVAVRTFSSTSNRLARRVRPGRSCRGVAPSPGWVDDPVRRWLAREAESHVVWVRGRDVRLHEVALCYPHSGSTRQPPLGAPGGGSDPHGRFRKCHHR